MAYAEDNIDIISMKHSAGFTLIESLIYALIFVIVVGGMMMFAISMLTSSERANAQLEVSDNARFLIQKFERTIQGATAINSPGIGASASSLSVTTASASSNPNVFDLSGGVIRLKQASGTPLPLTNSMVTVSSLSFTNYRLSTETKNTIRIRAKIQSVDPLRPVSSSIDIFISIQ